MDNVIHGIAPGLTRNGSWILKQLFAASDCITQWIAHRLGEIVAHKQGFIFIDSESSVAFLLGKTDIDEAFLNAVAIKQIIQM